MGGGILSMEEKNNIKQEDKLVLYKVSFSSESLKLERNRVYYLYFFESEAENEFKYNQHDPLILDYKKNIVVGAKADDKGIDYRCKPNCGALRFLVSNTQLKTDDDVLKNTQQNFTESRNIQPSHTEPQTNYDLTWYEIKFLEQGKKYIDKYNSDSKEWTETEIPFTFICNKSNLKAQFNYRYSQKEVPLKTESFIKILKYGGMDNNFYDYTKFNVVYSHKSNSIQNHIGKTILFGLITVGVGVFFGWLYAFVPIVMFIVIVILDQIFNFLPEFETICCCFKSHSSSERKEKVPEQDIDQKIKDTEIKD